MRYEAQPMTLVLWIAQKSANVNIYIFCSNSHKTKRLVYTVVKRQILYKSADRFKRSFKSIWNTYLPWQLTTFAWLQIIMTLECGRNWRCFGCTLYISYLRSFTCEAQYVCPENHRRKSTTEMRLRSLNISWTW